ncbi:MAG: hypothetical protein V7750_11130 [Sneathiella sp.]
MHIVVRLIAVGGIVSTAIASAFALTTTGNDAQYTTLQQLSIPAREIRPTTELIISGSNIGEARPVFFKIEHKESKSFGTRFNAERWIGTGPFKLYFPLHALNQKNNAFFPENVDVTVTAFAKKSDAKNISTHFEIGTTLNFPPNTIALDFGPAQSPVFPGFMQTLSTDSKITCARKCIEIRRPYHDSLIRDGISGVTRVSLNAEEGIYQLTLWLEDTGDWEYIPYHLEQRIIINGSIVSYRRETPVQWYNRTYTSPKFVKAPPAQTNWLTFAQHRGAPFTTTVTPKNGKITIELAGDRSSATHVAALLLEPADNKSAMKLLEKERSARANSRWPIIGRRDSWHTLSLPSQAPLTMPKDAIHFRGYVLESTGQNVNILHIEPARLEAAVLKTKAWMPIETLDRPYPNFEHLTRDNRKLHPILPGRVMTTDQIILQISTQPETIAGDYKGFIIYELNGAPKTLPYTVKVLDVKRPPLLYPIGVYLERNPAENWFRGDVEETASCIANIMTELGISTIAAPVPLAKMRDPQSFIDDLISWKASFKTVFAYAHHKTLEYYLGGAESNRLMAAGNLKAQALDKQIIWSIADEPAKGFIPRLIKKIHHIRAVDPKSILAGHLNKPELIDLANHLDIVLLNEGFGITGASLDKVRTFGAKPWLYNIKSPYNGAGLMASLLEAQGYMQWHGYMPTANPFDPTDGREGDVFLVYPSPSPCSPYANIDRTLIELSMAAEDAKWLQWLKVTNLETFKKLALRARNMDSSNIHGWSRLRTVLYKQIDKHFYKSKLEVQSQ